MAPSNIQKTSSTARNDASDFLVTPAALHTGTMIRTNTAGQPCKYAMNPQPTYIPGLSDFDRVEMILRDLRNKHRWSISDFLWHVVTAKSTKLYARTINNRTKNLTSAIAQDEVLKSLKFPEKLFDIGTSDLIRRLRAKLTILVHRLLALEISMLKYRSAVLIFRIFIYDRIRHGAPNIRELSNDVS